MSKLFEFLRTQILVRPAQRIIVARPEMQPSQMPEGVRLVRRRIAGARVPVRDRRNYRNVRGVYASWPEAGLHESNSYKMVCVLSGQIDFQVGRYAVQGGSGFCLVIPPGTPQPDGSRSYRAGSTPCQVLSILLHSQAVQCFISQTGPAEGGNKAPENYLFQDGRLALQLRLLLEEVTDERLRSETIGAELLTVFWRLLHREMEEQRYIHPGPVGRPVEMMRHPAGFEGELLHYIQTHLHQPLTLEGVARGLYLSRAQFVRRIRQETGKSFVQFLNDYRLQEARALLRDSDWTITAIARFLGFNSPKHFQEVFHRATGQSPSHYRNSERKSRNPPP